jgi:hypothetical protein
MIVLVLKKLEMAEHTPERALLQQHDLDYNFPLDLRVFGLAYGTDTTLRIIWKNQALI